MCATVATDFFLIYQLDVGAAWERTEWVVVLECIIQSGGHHFWQFVAPGLSPEVTGQPEGNGHRPKQIPDELRRRPNHASTIGQFTDGDPVVKVVSQSTQIASAGILVKSQSMSALESVNPGGLLNQP